MAQPKLDHYIGVYDNVVDEDFCRHVIAEFEDLNEHSWFAQNHGSDGGEQFQNAALGRKDTSLFFERTSRHMSKEINAHVGRCMEDYRKTYVGLQNLPIFSMTCKVQRTSERGGYHVWHHEHGPDIVSRARCAVWIMYLTSHEGEGETEFLQQGIRVAPQAGRVVIWPASYTHPHRGNPVYDGEKYIATGWFEYYYDIKHELEA